MSYDVEITFRGLCAFVPGGKLSSRKLPWLGVMLPNAVPANRTKFGINEEQHFAFVKYDINDLEQVGGGTSSGLWVLDEDDVVIVPGSSPENEVEVDYRGLTKEIPEVGEKEAFDWVPAIEDVMMGRGTLDEVLLDPIPVTTKLATESKLAARFHIKRGLVFTSEISTFSELPVVLELGDSGKRQVLAAEVKVLMKGVSGPLKVRARKFNQSTVRNLTFKEKASGSLKFTIINLCGENLGEFLADRKFLGSKRPEPDVDFRWHYILSTGAAAGQERLVPVPVRFARVTGGGGGEPARCSPPRFEQATDDQVRAMLEVAQEIENSN